MKKSIIILVIIVIVLGIGAYFYNFYTNVFKYNLSTQYQAPASNAQQVDSSNEVVAQQAPSSFMLIGKMLQVRIDSAKKPWWGQATIAEGDKPNQARTEVALELLGKLSENPDGTKFYAKIFKGDCSSESSSLYRLVPISVVYGKGAGSQSIIEMSLDNFLKNTPMAVQIYSDSDYRIPYACGVIR